MFQCMTEKWAKKQCLTDTIRNEIKEKYTEINLPTYGRRDLAHFII